MLSRILNSWLLGALLSIAMASAAHAQTALPPPPPPNLSSVAVSEVRPAPGANLPTYYSSYTLTREIESALDATRRFRVVSRSQGEAEAMADELQATRRRAAAAQSATYLVSVEVLGVDLRREVQNIPNMYGKARVQSIGRIEMRIAIRESATGAIRSRFPVEARVSTPAEIFDALNLPTAAGGSLGFVDLAKSAGKGLADRVLDEFYPVLVIQRQGNTVFLNRGEDSGYRIGETLRVFTGSGERMKDPYTGEDLGPLETQLGTIRVSDMRPKVTMAEVITETGAIGQGAIVRKAIERER